MTAEFAVALPAIALVLAASLAAVHVAAVQVRLTDAAADAARLVARGEPEARALALLPGAVDGASATVVHRGDLVCVDAAAPARLPIPELRAASCALAGGQ